MWLRTKIEVLVMNIKFRMPRLWSNVKVRSTVKELSLTIVATTISIILTFGTAAYLDDKQQKADGRKTAMLVIHDIEQSAKQIDSYIKREEDNYKLTVYVLEHLDNVGNIRNDSLNRVLHYILRSKQSTFDFDDSTEKLFLSSQDVWKNINNATYIDVVQRFFYERRVVYESMNTLEVFRKPITEEEVWQHKYFKPNGVYDFSAFIADHLTRPDVQMYLTNSSARITYFNGYMDLFRADAKRCKFMMEISDEELSDFIARRMNPGLPPTDKQLEGIWTMDEGGESAQDFEFKKDHTFTLTTTTRFPHTIYIGRLKVITSNTGTWQIEGDSIILFYNPEMDYELDRSGITVLADKDKQVDELIARWEQAYEDYKTEASKQPVTRGAGTIFIDRLGKRIEIQNTDQGSYGYFTRKEQ